MAPHLLSHFDRTARWMRRGGQENDVVISSRVRLARNFRRYLFPHRAAPTELMAIRHQVFTALPHLNAQGSAALNKALEQTGILPFEEFTNWERHSLIDRHLTSREHVREEVGRGLAAAADASLCVLVNEEDHLRLKSMLPGLQLDTAYLLVDKLDDALEKFFDQHATFAYFDNFGYITACPTNAGTGMRASVMLHLPALEIAGRTKAAQKFAKERDFALRGTFGEGSKVWGHLHQLSNQATLGLDEAEILLEVEEVTRHLCEMEREARHDLPQQFFDVARDAVGRAYGNLRYARCMGCREATDHLSFLRLGMELNWVKGLTRQRFNELLIWIRPAYLQVLHGRALSSQERDTLRASLLRDHMQRIKLEAVLTAADDNSKSESQPADEDN